MAQQQGFHSTDPMQSYARQDLFGLQTSMEMLGFPQKDSNFEQQHRHQQQQERDPARNPSMPSSSSWRSGGGGFFPKVSAADPSSHYYDNATAFSETNEWVHPFQPLLPATATNQLSLSLFDTNTRASDVAMQGQQQHTEGREDWFHQQQHQQQQPYQELRRSKYLVPAQELLNEFCSIESSHGEWKKKKSKAQSQWEEGGASSSSSSWSQSLQSMDILELQRRKARLLFMLEEVDRRYRRYCEQMRSVVAGFEAVAGEGVAAVYAAMARKAMSRHFRCLRDGIVGQVRATKKAMGEKEGVGAPGATRGETPRLRVLDQCLRQQKLLQQGGMMESHPWRPQRGLPERSVSILRSWLFEHFLHPYPSDVDKHILARQTGLTRSQISNWFINARVRLWKPMVEEMYLEENKDQENQSSATSTTHHDLLISPTNPNHNLPHAMPLEDQKPDSDSLSSVIIGATSLDVRNLPRAIHNHHHQQLVDVDFSSYSDNGHQQSFANNVSLTLGLQQHDDGGRGLSYPPTAIAVAPSSQSSMFFGKEPVQLTVLEGDGQNMSHPYRNLMEAHLLHDLAR